MDAVAAATPTLDCSTQAVYEPLIGLRLAALFSILAVSSCGGRSCGLCLRDRCGTTANAVPIA